MKIEELGAMTDIVGVDVNDGGEWRGVKLNG